MAIKVKLRKSTKPKEAKANQPIILKSGRKQSRNARTIKRKDQRSLEKIQQLVEGERNLSLERLQQIFSHRLVKTFADGLAPKPELTITEWADKNRQLPQVSGYEAGQWRTSRFPFLKRIQDLLSPSDPTQKIVVMKSSQLGFTEVSLNWMLYVIDYHPVPMLYVQKTLDNIGVFMDQRFDPALEEMPEVKDKIGTLKIGKNTGNTKKMKIFAGGMIRFGGANSAASLRSMAIAYLVLDEEDSYEGDIQDEGSPSQLAIVRTSNFPNKKVYHISTPTIKETSVIEPLYEGGTQEKYYIPCPHCGNMDHMKWENLKWSTLENGLPDLTTIALDCENCHCLIEEHHKTDFLAAGIWTPHNAGAPYPSFHINSLYVPYGFYSWSEMVQEYTDAIRKNDSSLMKTFRNTRLGKSWSESSKTLKASHLEKRKETYLAMVPNDCVLLTSAWDVQDNRIEGGVVGWTRDRQKYWIDYKQFLGDPQKEGVWKQLDLYLLKLFRNERNDSLPLAMTVIDQGGHASKQVSNFCKLREHRNIFPIFGRSGWGKGLIERPKQRNKNGVYLYGVYVDETKSKLYSELNIEDRDEAGYWHFPNKDPFDKNWFKMLTAENLQTKYLKGKYTLKWHLPEGQRNEALDVSGYNIAALEIINPDFDTVPLGGLYPVAYGKTRSNKYDGKPSRRKVHSTGI